MSAETSSNALPLEPENCVVIFAPYGKDAALLAGALQRADIESFCVSDGSEFCRRLSACAAGLLTAEAIRVETIRQVQEALHAQPAWSDVPLILLTKRLDAASYRFLNACLGNVTILQSPLEPDSLLTVVSAALRARRRQYQVRDLLHTEREQAEHIHLLNERLRRAMTETHHRVKNNLQLINAFMDLQLDDYEEAVPVKEVRRLQSQIITLAAVHDVLTREAKDGTAESLSAKVFLERLLGMLVDIAGEKQLHYDLVEARISSQQGASLALIANELVLNALKHCRQEVWVELTDDAEQIRLTVSDDGNGLPEGFSVGVSSNTGLALVENLTRWDLRGQTEYGNRPDAPGACIRVIFPHNID